MHPEYDNEKPGSAGGSKQGKQATTATQPHAGIAPAAVAGEEAPTFARDVTKIMPTFGTARQDKNLVVHADLSGASTVVNMPAQGALTPSIGAGYVLIRATTDDATGGTLTSLVVKGQEGTVSGTTFTPTKTETLVSKTYSPAITINQTNSASVLEPFLSQINVQRLQITVGASGTGSAVDIGVGATSGDS